MDRLSHLLPELVQLEFLLDEIGERATVSKLANIEVDQLDLPIYAISFDRYLENPKTAPTFALVGGVHGLERIGTQVILSYLQSIVTLLKWDHVIHDLLKRVKIVFLPMLNPSGMLLQRRANLNGVDLMRNAPIDAEEKGSPIRIYRGHRISPGLPWYRGKKNQMEKESKALCKLIKKELFHSQLGIALDVHSGFGVRDRLWFPYAKSKRLFDHAAEVLLLKSLLDETLPNHVYKVEPQSKQYTTHGDLWDYLYDQHKTSKQSGLFLPLTLEMGSWSWLRKNPLQLLSPLGLFHPMKPHRVRRVLRRHWPLFEFLVRFTSSDVLGNALNQSRRERLRLDAVEKWGVWTEEHLKDE